jgi:hypothetical protein
LSPVYNLCKKAGSILGRKHTPETINKFRSRKLSNETKDKLRLNSSIPTFIRNIRDDSIKECSSIQEAIKYLNTSKKTFYLYVNTGKLFKEIYILNTNNYKMRNVYNSKPIVTINIVTNQICNYISIMEVARHFNVTDHIIKHSISKNLLFNNTYIIKYDIDK